MKKQIAQLFLLLSLCGFIVPSSLKNERDILKANDSLSVITVEGDVILGNTLPLYGTLCENTSVFGSPYENMEVRYVLGKGSTVRLREQSHGDDRSWVMIKPAYWIKLSALCEG